MLLVRYDNKEQIFLFPKKKKRTEDKDSFENS